MGKSLQDSDFTRYATGQLLSADATHERTHTTLRFAVWNNYDVIEVPVQRDIYIGRTTQSSEVEVDLEPYNAQVLGVSRKHALIRQFPHKFVLIDLDSTNGSKLNGINIIPRRPYTIKSGDEIQIGGVVMKLIIF